MKTINKLKQSASRNLVNIPGWRTDRKIVVFESDDWGSIRMPSREVYDNFLNKGIPVDKCPYCKYDSLASEEDLNALFNTLIKFKDSNDNHPVITANVIVANPNFDKIKESDYREYYFELVSDTFKKYPKHSNCLAVWKEAQSEGLFYPQLHGREHLNTSYWLELLQNKHPDFLLAFENNFWGLSQNLYPDMKRSVQASLDMVERDEIHNQKRIIREACQLFENIFQYKSQSFIANNFIWDSSLNESLFDNGVKFIQGMKYQKMPIYKNQKRKLIRHYLGEQNKIGQCHLIRNSMFEPSQKKLNYDNVGECIKGIANAFFWNKPAIISTHRLNFVGFLNIENRDRNLVLLEELLNKILEFWPDVEFLTSDQLGQIIENYE